MPLEVPDEASSSGGASAMGRPNWIISLPWPFMGLLETTNVCPASWQTRNEKSRHRICRLSKLESTRTLVHNATTGIINWKIGHNFSWALLWQSTTLLFWRSIVLVYSMSYKPSATNAIVHILPLHFQSKNKKKKSKFECNFSLHNQQSQDLYIDKRSTKNH